MSELMSERGMLEVESLPFWTGPIKIWPIGNGATNRNYGVQQADGQRFAVRLGQDLPQHGVMRFNEQAAAQAAARAGISPKIYFTAPGVIVSRLLPGRSLSVDEVRLPQNLHRIAALMRRCHTGTSGFLQGPLLAFWVFHLNRTYASALDRSQTRLDDMLPRLVEINDALERRVGKVDIALGHNDLMASNVFDDGVRLWLLDWDHAGFNSPLFDLASLSVNNNFYVEDDAALLESYFGAAQPESVWDGFRSFKCAALLRRTLWSAITETSPDARYGDYQVVTDESLSRLDTALAELD
jgi:thiamine kinase-like enzyme